MSGKEFGLSSNTIDQIRSVFRSYPAIDQALIYGSRAKGTFKTGSDIDLVLVGSALSTDDLLKIERELDDLPIPYEVDLSILHQIDSPDLLDHIHRVGKVFYQKA